MTSSHEEMHEMEHEVALTQHNLLPAYPNMNELLRQYISTFLRHHELITIAARIPFMSTGKFTSTFYAGESVMVSDTMFTLATIVQWTDCRQGTCRKPKDCNANKPRNSIMESVMLCRHINDKTYELKCRKSKVIF